jgi:ligand-binding sensor domain-containing protein/serine phosphatase RsbU (regulator of sigma subunit)
MTRTLFRMSIFLLLALPLAAQQHNFTNYSVEQGLQSQVTALFQDSRGYVWIGTQGGGLFRFDGVHFKQYTKTDGLSNNFVTSICEDKKGALWVGTANGADKFDGNTFSKQLDSLFITRICCTKKGVLWIAADKGAYSFDGTKMKHFSKEDGLADGPVKVIFEDGSGDMWFFLPDARSLDRYNGKTVEHFTEVNCPMRSAITSMCVDASGKLWLSTWKGELFAFNGNTFKEITTYFKGKGEINALITDKRGNVWIAKYNGVFRTNGSDTSFVHYDQTNGLSANNIKSLMEDRNGNVWIGTDGGGVNKFSGELFTHFGKESGLAEAPFALKEDANANVWFRMGNGRVGFCTDTSILVYDSPGKGLDYRSTLDLVSTAKKIIYLPTEKGMYTYDGHKFDLVFSTDYYKTFSGSMRSMYEDNKGDMWLGVGGRGPGRITGKNKIEFLLDTCRSTPLSMFRDSKNIFWFGTSYKGVYKYDGATVSVLRRKGGHLGGIKHFYETNDHKLFMIPNDGGVVLHDPSKGTGDDSFIYYDRSNGFTSEGINQVLKGKDGTFWFASDGDGVFIFENGKFTNLNKNNGINNAVMSIVDDSQGRVWAGTNDGLYRITRNKDGFGIKHYGKSEGFAGIECNTESALRDSKGNLWFGTSTMLTRYDPSKDVADTLAPLIQITGLRLFFETADWTNYSDSLSGWYHLPVSLVLPHSKNHLTFSFVGIDHCSPENVRYRFMIEGLDKDWSPETEKTEITYSNLPPGDYVFKVKARNVDGVWNETPASFKFAIQSPWYSNKYAYTGYVFAFFGIVFGFNGVRTRQLKLRQEALEATVRERTQEVVQQKEVIEMKNHEITDSITYAQRIQLSILPPIEEIKAALPDSFVLFKPKDIVSGDFYWSEKKDDAFLLAAADCTGHGVPGAFMSMLGAEKLSEAAALSGDVSGILQQLNKGVKKALRQSEKDSSTRDGMDIALLSISKQMKKILYAGANRPLYLIRGPEFTEIKATKVAIGGLTPDDQEFQQHEIALQKGDTIYICTDGYADQFSPEDKKLMTRKFKELLVSIQDKTMEEQKQFLNHYIENWKGNLEQTDDILVIGIRV